MTTAPLRTRRLALPGLVTAMALCLLALPAVAHADTATSSNWSGFVAHHSGVHYRSISGYWKVPAVTCRYGSPGYSAMWVGIGGFNQNSSALEQTGTESDCSNTGEAHYYAWYELVPAPSHPIGLRVRPGDQMHGQVNISGRRVTLRLYNLTQHRTFARTLTASSLDTTSADWILEAPSLCTSNGVGCTTEPLADFGQAIFTGAWASTPSRHSGSISSHWWSRTKIYLTPGSGPFAGTASSVGPGGASPSNLRNGGRAFTITYHPFVQPVGSHFATRASLRSAQVVHPLFSR